MITSTDLERANRLLAKPSEQLTNEELEFLLNVVMPAAGVAWQDFAQYIMRHFDSAIECIRSFAAAWDDAQP